MKIFLSFAIFLALLAVSNVQAQTANKPLLKIVTPSEGQTIFGDKVPILVSVENFEIVDFQTNTLAKSGQGHIHLWLDDANPTRESAVKLTSDNFTYSSVNYGNHTLKAELVNNNHTSLTAPVVTTVNFKTAPVSIASSVPAVSGFDKNTAIVILIVVALVIVAAWWYTKEEDEEEVKSQSVKSKAKRTRNTSRRRKK